MHPLLEFTVAVGPSHYAAHVHRCHNLPIGGGEDLSSPDSYFSQATTTGKLVAVQKHCNVHGDISARCNEMMYKYKYCLDDYVAFENLVRYYLCTVCVISTSVLFL